MVLLGWTPVLIMEVADSQTLVQISIIYITALTLEYRLIDTLDILYSVSYIYNLPKTINPSTNIIYSSDTFKI